MVCRDRRGGPARAISNPSGRAAAVAVVRRCAARLARAWETKSPPRRSRQTMGRRWADQRSIVRRQTTRAIL
eukprot:5066592-Pyramimonas_sp.AAC.1